MDGGHHCPDGDMATRLFSDLDIQIQIQIHISRFQQDDWPEILYEVVRLWDIMCPWVVLSFIFTVYSEDLYAEELFGGVVLWSS